MFTTLVPELRARCKYPAECTYHGLVYILGSTKSCKSPGLMFTLDVHTNRRCNHISPCTLCGQGRGEAQGGVAGQARRPLHGQPAETPPCGS